MSDAGLRVKAVDRPSSLRIAQGDVSVLIELSEPLTAWDRVALGRTSGYGLTVLSDTHLAWDRITSKAGIRSVLELHNGNLREIALRLEREAEAADLEALHDLQVLAAEFGFEIR